MHFAPIKWINSTVINCISPFIVSITLQESPQRDEMLADEERHPIVPLIASSNKLMVVDLSLFLRSCMERLKPSRGICLCQHEDDDRPSEEKIEMSIRDCPDIYSSPMLPSAPVNIDLDPTCDSHHSRIRTREASVRYFLGYLHFDSTVRRPTASETSLFAHGPAGEMKAGLAFAVFTSLITTVSSNLVARICHAWSEFTLICTFQVSFSSSFKIRCLRGQREDINSHCGAESSLQRPKVECVLGVFVKGILSEQLDAAHPHESRYSNLRRMKLELFNGHEGDTRLARPPRN